MNVAEAKLCIPDEHVQKWWEHFCSFAGFIDMWSIKGWAKTQVLPMLLQLDKASNPPILQKGKGAAFILPIIDRDWCIRAVQLNTTTITHGAVWAGIDGLALFDFDQRLVHFVSYESLSGVNQQADTINLTTNQGSTISIAIRVSRPSRTARIGGALFGAALVLSSERVADEEVYRQRNERMENEYWHRVDAADSYAVSVQSFFSEIISRKNQLDGT